MPYGFIVLVGSIALVVYFVFATEASWISKAVVSALFVFSLASFLHLIAAINSFIGLFILVALSIFIILYRTVQEARSGK